MQLTEKNILNKINEIFDTLTRVNIYKNNILYFISSDLKENMPKHHYELLIVDCYRLLLIDLYKLIFNHRLEILNIFKYVENLNENQSLQFNVSWEKKHKKTISKVKDYTDTNFAYYDFIKFNEFINLGELATLIMDLNFTFIEICKILDIECPFNALHEEFNFFTYFGTLNKN